MTSSTGYMQRRGEKPSTPSASTERESKASQHEENEQRIGISLLLQLLVSHSSLHHYLTTNLVNGLIRNRTTGTARTCPSPMPT